jgi:hypothetical protein
VILTSSFTVGDGRIVTLLIIAAEPATTPQRRQPECSGSVPQTDGKDHRMPDANEHLRVNPPEGTSGRDAEKRRAATERAYAEDRRLLDSEPGLAGRRAVSDRVRKIPADAPAGLVLEEDGPAYAGPGTAAQPRAVRPARQSRAPRDGRTHAA